VIKAFDVMYDSISLSGIGEYYRTATPGGAFYIYPEVPERLRETFVDRVIEQELLVVPGTAFSPRPEITHFRISYAATDSELQRGVDILRTIAATG
jgi:aspartate/methionine/tyrosine aminotransferase